ncbi:MAG: hypothetical protein DSY89_03600 [Deltaproteobacteria bacterium]|nr:MAG: hypothetical protein DSY89_03600 [Deltaproteobacteria bacterium]
MEFHACGYVGELHPQKQEFDCQPEEKMKYFLRYTLTGLFIILAFTSPVRADMGDTALGVKIGTLGIGAEMTFGLTPGVNARVGISGFSYGYDTKVEEIDYEFDLNLFSASLLADWHFSGGSFRLTGGLFLNLNELDFKAKTDRNRYIIDDIAYSVDDVGRLRGTIDFNTISPYLGIGWGNAVGQNGRICFFIDIGMLFQGSPQASLKATGPIRADSDFQHHLRNEEREIEDETDKYTIYPVIAIGVTFKF